MTSVYFSRENILGLVFGELMVNVKQTGVKSLVECGWKARKESCGEGGGEKGFDKLG